MRPTRSVLTRLIRRAVLCVALGLVTTIAVAWSLAAWLPHSDLWVAQHWGTHRSARSTGLMSTEEFGRIGMHRRAWGIVDPGTSQRFFPKHGFRPAPETYRLTPGPLWGEPPSDDLWPPEARDHAYEDARGWPMLALWCEFQWGWSPSRGGGWSASNGIVLSAPATRSMLEVRVLPLMPIWTGLLVNAAVYALAWGALLLILDWIRRSRRRRRQLCTICAYDLRGLAARDLCPECGTPTAA